ncbi:MAG: hypothetical protein WD200_00320 [Candidatus Andersenbacteria bacterium]
MRHLFALPINNTIVAILLAAVTYTIQIWNRSSQNTVGLSTPEQKKTALIIFISTLVALYITPFITALLTKRLSSVRKWPTLEILLVVAGIPIAIVMLFSSQLLPYPLNRGIFIAISSMVYVALIAAYSFMIKKLIDRWKDQRDGGMVMSIVGALILGLTIYIMNSIVVYFE